MSDDLRRLTDRAEITDGLHAYCRHVDHNRPDLQVAMFTDDCRVTYGGGRWFEGRAALLAGLRAALASYRATTHHLSNIEISFEGDRDASVESVVLAWHAFRDATPDMVLHARYRDRWVRTASGWRASRRELLVSGVEGGAPGTEARLTPFEREA